MRAARLLAMLLAVAALLPGCFNPKLEPGFECGEDGDQSVCPDGFFCDDVTYTCLRDGTTPTRPAVDLGAMQPGPVAARLGDNVVVAGWVFDPGPGTSVFRVRTFGPTGRPVGQAFDPSELSDIEPTSLRAAGSDTAAVIAGRINSSRQPVMIWVTSAGAQAEDTGVLYDAFTVMSGQQVACFAGAFTPQSGNSFVDAKCNNGTPGSWMQRPMTTNRGIVSLAAGVADDPSQFVVVAELPGQSGTDPHDLFALCPGQAAPTDPFILGGYPPPGNDLSPQLFYSPADSLVQVAWKALTGLKTLKLTWPACASPGAADVKDVGNSSVTDFALVGRGRSTGFGSAPGSWALDLHHAGVDPSIADMISALDVSFSAEHPIVSSPHAAVTKDNAPWFFFFAADSDTPTRGWVKYTSLNSMGQDLRFLQAQITPDFAVARRNAGTFFVVYREDQDGTGAGQPLPTYLALLDSSGDLEAPSE
jgi:hypothetical protein